MWAITTCIGQLPLSCNTHSLKDERLICLMDSGFGPWSAGSEAETSWQKGMVEQRCLLHGGQEAKKTGDQHQRGRDKGQGIVSKVTPPWPIQTYQEMYSTNPLDGSQTNELDTIKLNGHTTIYQRPNHILFPETVLGRRLSESSI